MKHVVYFGQTPDQGTGSPITMLRHLERLSADGWKLSVVAERGQSTQACDDRHWPLHHLSLRKFWWPPYRPDNPWLRSLRMFLWAREAAQKLQPPPDAVFAYLSAHSDLLAEVAAHYCLHHKIPLSIFVCDYPPDFPNWQPSPSFLQRQNWILQAAHQIWFVSPQLADKYSVPAHKKTVLLPIPHGPVSAAQWHPGFAQTPVLVYAGYIYPVQHTLLRTLGREIAQAGGRLLLLTKTTPEIAQLCREEPIDHRDLFPTNLEALNFVASHAAGFLVSYSTSLDEMPWTATSYPSKLVEFSHTGLPTLIVAPALSAVGIWAKSRQYRDFITPDQMDLVKPFVAALKQPSTWRQKSEAVLQLANQEFNPELIHRRFEQALTTTPTERPQP